MIRADEKGREGREEATRDARQGKRERVEFNFGEGFRRRTGKMEATARARWRNEKGPINGIAAQYIE